MATNTPTIAPVLSTPATNIFEDPTPVAAASDAPQLSDEQVALTYEIARTVREIRQGRWKRVALQFPDAMLRDAPRVYGGLERGLRDARAGKVGKTRGGKGEESGENGLRDADLSVKMEGVQIEDGVEDGEEKLFILGDTSYGACCVDEVAAEHVDADVVVHYGRSCLSPTSRLPVIYVFTERPLDLDAVVSAFTETYPDNDAHIVLMADIPYAHHIAPLHARLVSKGYTHIFATDIIHDPTSLLPNRTTPPETKDAKDALRSYALFHISNPPPALLLTLHSRVASVHIYPTASSTPTPRADLVTSTSRALSRRYALLASLASTPIIGILLNTLSIRNHLTILSHTQRLIAAAGKHHYTVVVGKVNPAKVANFAEVGGWVVLGCWENSLVQGEWRDGFWKPMVTPWELEVALRGDGRVWTGEWEGGFQGVLDAREGLEAKADADADAAGSGGAVGGAERGAVQATTTSPGDTPATDIPQDISDEESEPPDFDLRTGRYVSHARPMHASPQPPVPVTASTSTTDPADTKTSTALSKRGATSLATINGVASPGAEFLRSGRTWQGLGSEFAAEDGDGESRSARMEEGRRGIARGYAVGGEGEGR